MNRAMDEKPTKLKKLFRTPTDLELAILYLLLGIYVAVATDAVLPFPWETFTLYSLPLAVLLIVFRIINFVYALFANTVTGLWRRWTQLGLIALAMILIFGTNLDLRLRLWLSERSLYEDVKRIQLLSAEGQRRMYNVGPLTRGFFNVWLSNVDAASGTIWFRTADGVDLFGPPCLMGGIVYSKQGLPPERGESTYQHLYGPWWRWLQDY